MEKNNELDEYVKENLDSLKNLKYRLNTEDGKRDRNPFERDYARVLYSSSFRRLQGKMQLLGVQNDKFFRNRLTHSLEVAQIARSIANKIGYKPDESLVVEMGALAHDIGNPPFGHYGEKVLNNLCLDIGGFEGNAQTLRLLTKLEKKNPNTLGLNLTARSLFAIVKYFNKYDANCGKFIYFEDYQELSKIIQHKKIKVRTLDVQIVDLADEIAYAAHDLEDALSMKLFTIDELLFEFNLLVKEKVKSFDLNYKYAYEFFNNDIVNKAKEFANKATSYNSSEEYAMLFRKEVTSNIVHQLIKDIDLIKISDKVKKDRGSQHEKELGFKILEPLANGLKDITFKCINTTDTIQLYEKQGKVILEGLFYALMNEKFNDKDKLLPAEFRYSKDDKKRRVVDYIAGMMDSYAISLYKKYYGQSCLDKIYQEKIFQ